jgi:hypothetical protein
MSGDLWALASGIGASGAAVFALGAAHWASLIALGGRELPVLARYVVGCVLMLGLFGGWCLAQPGPVPAGWAWATMAGVMAGAGVGTSAAHALDWAAGKRGEEALRGGQQRARADRGR